MREILFRGKRLDNSEWVYGFLVYKKDPVLGLTYCFIVAQHDKESFVTWYKVDPATIGQYTGLMDKNGNRIFEGDILEGRDFDAEDGYGVVEWDDGAWEVISEGNWLGTFHDNYNGFELEVIGNIHDNLELFEEET